MAHAPTKHLSFSNVARAASHAAGSSTAFVIAIAALIVWLVSGPFFHFNDTWQLIVNTATTVITFLMVFLIQGSQNLDTQSLHIKIDELIQVTPKADDELMDLEKMDEKALKSIHARYESWAKHAHAELSRRGVPPAV